MGWGCTWAIASAPWRPSTHLPSLGCRHSLATGISGLLQAIRLSQQSRQGTRAPVSQPEEATGAKTTRQTRGQAHACRGAVIRTDQRRGAHRDVAGRPTRSAALTTPDLDRPCPTARHQPEDEEMVIPPHRPPARPELCQHHWYVDGANKYQLKKGIQVAV